MRDCNCRFCRGLGPTDSELGYHPTDDMTEEEAMAWEEAQARYEDARIDAYMGRLEDERLGYGGDW